MLAAEAGAASSPTVSTGRASSLTTSAATLNGTVNPEGLSTRYFFQYGTSRIYGSTTGPTDAGSGTHTKAAAADLIGLTPFTRYHYRLVAQNSKGTTFGGDRTFTTKKQPLGFSLAAGNVTRDTRGERRELQVGRVGGPSHLPLPAGRFEQGRHDGWRGRSVHHRPSPPAGRDGEHRAPSPGPPPIPRYHARAPCDSHRVPPARLMPWPGDDPLSPPRAYGGYCARRAVPAVHVRRLGAAAHAHARGPCARVCLVRRQLPAAAPPGTGADDHDRRLSEAARSRRAALLSHVVTVEVTDAKFGPT